MAKKKSSAAAATTGAPARRAASDAQQKKRPASGDDAPQQPPRKKSAKESAQAAAKRRASQDFAPFADLVSLEPRELAKRLEQAQTALGHTRQEDARPRGLAKLARQLATPEISEHRSTSVRLWAATCVCEVLRIFAPNAPYGDGELLAAFRLLGAALKAAGAASNGRDGDLARRQARHVIESLRQFQSACALTELYASGAEGSQNGLLDFCDALLRSVSGETSSELRDATLDVMSGVVAQLDAIPDGLVELLLVSLLPSGRKAAPTTHWLAQAVVRRGADALTRPVAAWLNGCLSLSPTEGIVTPENEKKKKRRRRSDDSSSSSEEDEETPLKRIGQDTLAKSDASGANAYALVFEVHLAEPRMLLYTLPKVSERLLAEDDRTREATLTLLGRLFASPKEDYASSYPGIYQEWLRRFHDKCSEVRCAMVRVSLRVAAAKPQLRAALIEQCAERTQDKDWEVRRAATRSLADAMLDTAPSGLKDSSGGKDWDVACESLRRVAKDKRPEIRKECLTGLATLFRAHVSDNWEDSEEALNATCSNGLKRLGFVPSLLVQSYASSVNVGEVSERARLLLDDHMLDSKSDDDMRGCAFVSTVASSVIEDSVESSLGALFARTAVSQRALSALLDAIESARASEDKTRANQVVKTAVEDVVRCLPGQNARTLVQQLTQARDRKIFRSLATSNDLTKSRDVRRAARDDAVKRIAASGKRDCASYVSKLLKKTGDAVLDAQSFSAILQRASRSDADKVVLRGATLACTLLAQRHPSLLAASSEAVVAFTTASADARHPQAFTAAARACQAIGSKAKDADSSLRKVATAQGSWRGDDDDDEDGFLAACAKEGVAALASLHDETGGSTILDALDDKSDDCWIYGASRLLARLRALTRVVELFPEDIATSDVVTRVKTSLIDQRPPPDLAFDENEGRSSLSGSDFGRPKNDQAFAEAFLALRAALKVVTACARPLQDKECGREKAARQDAFDLCFKVIESDGEPPSGAQCTSEERAELRLTAASNALALCCANKEANRELSASRYASLASVLVDRDDVVRNEFARKLSQAVSSGQASFAKWAGALVLVALAPASGSDEKEEKRKAVAMASRALRVAVARQRRSHAQAIRRLPPGAGTNEVDRLATRYLPDYALPYAVHNIARTTRDDAKVSKALLLLLEPLVATAGDKGVAFLLAACADMSGHDDASGSGPCPFDHIRVSS
uniref:Sister chromatid cohesion protein n=1 Tax=Pelagomonas calceolata TaxID=35677 RepID=A0A7S3ZQM5_9STRA